MSKARISIIAAIASNNAIGKDNQLLWHLPKDFQFFKQHTSEKTIIMGKNTWLSLPQKPLPLRRNIIVSRTLKMDANEQLLCCSSIDDIPWDSKNENMIIGGASLYEYFLPIADKLYLTLVKSNPQADTFFPKIDFTQWQQSHHQAHAIDDKHKFEFSCNIYHRRLS